VLPLLQTAERNRFLASHVIQENVGHIPGMTLPLASVLQSYGVESAADIDSVRLMGIPMLTPSITMELLNWRERVEGEFVFKPDGVTTADKESEEDAIMRFKTYQGRRVLVHAKHLESLADAAGHQLEKELAQFYDFSTKTRDVAVEMRDFQSGRRPLERFVNRSPRIILAAALATPLIGWLIYFLLSLPE
jgi:DNA-binding helix-hairpin-helix protein with protein kinase domain